MPEWLVFYHFIFHPLASYDHQLFIFIFLERNTQWFSFHEPPYTYRQFQTIWFHVILKVQNLSIITDNISLWESDDIGAPCSIKRFLTAAVLCYYHRWFKPALKRSKMMGNFQVFPRQPLGNVQLPGDATFPFQPSIVRSRTGLGT